MDTAIFDLDGTLIDSLADLAAAGNHAMTAVGRPTHPVHAYRRLAGQGLEQLVRDALGPDHQGLFREAIAAQRAYYQAHALDQTRPFDGVPELLQHLKSAGWKLAVLSNKPHEATVRTVAALLPEVGFDAVIGHRPPVPVKPDPASALALAVELGVAPSAVAYVGDTAADMQTAVSAGFRAIGVTWGFREADELWDTGAQRVVDDVAALRAALLQG